jgi:hypothetical protein
MGGTFAYTVYLADLNNANTISLEQRIGRIEARTRITLGGTLACTVPVSRLVRRALFTF